MQIFAGVREIWGVKQESGRLRCRFSYLLFSLYFPNLTQCCRAFTL